MYLNKYIKYKNKYIELKIKTYNKVIEHSISQINNNDIIMKGGNVYKEIYFITVKRFGTN